MRKIKNASEVERSLRFARIVGIIAIVAVIVALVIFVHASNRDRDELCGAFDAYTDALVDAVAIPDGLTPEQQERERALRESYQSTLC